MTKKINITWDEYFMNICNEVAKNSKCMSRRVGALIVRDKSIISTGYNGPPRGIIPCSERVIEWTDDKVYTDFEMCPRQFFGYASGEGLHLCPAAHAEVNAITNAARLGVSVLGASLYLNTISPCKNCAGLIINAGIKEVISISKDPYDTLGIYMLKETGIAYRTLM